MSERKLLLLGWDGVDRNLTQRLLSSGKLPYLGRLMADGQSAPLAGPPQGSWAGWWTSVATGMWPHEHGVLGGGVAAFASSPAEPLPSRRRRHPAFWNVLAAHGVRQHVIAWPEARPAEPIHGWFVSPDWAWSGSSRATVQCSEENVHLDACRVAPDELDPRLFGFFLEENTGGESRDEIIVPEPLRRELAALYTCHNAAIATLDSNLLAS